MGSMHVGVHGARRVEIREFKGVRSAWQSFKVFGPDGNAVAEFTIFGTGENPWDDAIPVEIVRLTTEVEDEENIRELQEAAKED